MAVQQSLDKKPSGLQTALHLRVFNARTSTRSCPLRTRTAHPVMCCHILRVALSGMAQGHIALGFLFTGYELVTSTGKIGPWGLGNGSGICRTLGFVGKRSRANKVEDVLAMWVL